ncbi:hypothetical protein C6P45_001585 [Maudiozyma exigua]|uniref:TATA-binding protein interacting (TIP20) domain-containing protein n=1 Tax=Maudiozyma exigua TaxID=34358 RepID=A0A9P6W0J4_MAUEX|nr:hypothetical protein C6P45_001585 [Kazachstania exigua]
MIILKIIEQYYASTDSDLQYMALRNEFTINDIDNDVSLLMNKLVLPILLTESNMTIVNLVCYELLPKFMQCVRYNYSSNSDIFKLIENRVLIPITNNIRHPDRSLIFMQCSKMLFKKIFELIDLDQRGKSRSSHVNIPSIIFNNNDSFVLLYLKNLGEMNLFETEKYLCYENLNYLLPLYYDGHTHCVPKEIIISLLKQYSQEELINPTTQTLIGNLSRLTSSIELSYCSEYIDDSILLDMSKYWYKFNILIDDYFDTKLLPKLEVSTIDNLDEFIDILKIIINFGPFYSTRILHIGLPYLAQENVIRLIKNCIKLLNITSIGISQKKLENDMLTDSVIADRENSIAIAANDERQYIKTTDSNNNSSSKVERSNDKYVEELSLATGDYQDNDEDEDEDEYFEMEDETVDISVDGDDNQSTHTKELVDNIHYSKLEENDNNNKIEKIAKIKSMVLSILQSCDISLQTEKYFMEMPNLSVYNVYRDMGLAADKNAIATLFKFQSTVQEFDLNIILNDPDYFKKYSKDDIFATLDYKSASSVNNIRDLQFCVDIVEKLIRDENFKLTIRDQAILALILLPHIKKNKEFIRVLKVGNMKQKVDNGLATRTSIYSILSQMDTLQYNVSCKIIEEIVIHGLKDKNATIQFLSETILDKILSEYYNTIQGLAQGWYQVAIMNKLLEILYGSNAVSTTEASVLSNIIDTYPSVTPRHDD